MLLYMDRYMYIYRYLSKYNVYRYLIPPTCVFVNSKYGLLGWKI